MPPKPSLPTNHVPTGTRVPTGPPNITPIQGDRLVPVGGIRGGKKKKDSAAEVPPSEDLPNPPLTSGNDNVSAESFDSTEQSASGNKGPLFREAEDWESLFEETDCSAESFDSSEQSVSANKGSPSEENEPINTQNVSNSKTPPVVPIECKKSQNFTLHGIPSPQSEPVFIDKTAVLAILSILRNSNLTNEIGDDSKTKRKLKSCRGVVSVEDSFCQFLLKDVIQFIFEYVGIMLNDRTRQNILNVLTMNGENIVSFSYILQVSNTCLFPLQEITQNYIDNGCSKSNERVILDVVADIVAAIAAVDATDAAVAATDADADFDVAADEMSFYLMKKQSSNYTPNTVLKYIIDILNSHSDISTRFALLIQIFKRIPKNVLGEKKDFDMNKLLMSILFKSNRDFFTSTEDPTVLYEIVVSLLKKVKMLISQQASIVIPHMPDSADSERSVSRKQETEKNELIQKKSDIDSMITCILWTIVVIFRQVPFKQVFKDGSAVILFSNESTKSSFELIFFELVSLIEKNNLPEFFKILCFDTDLILRLAINAIKINPSCTDHLSRVSGPGSDQIDLSSLYNDVFNVNAKFDVIQMSHGVGAGKTTMAALAALFHAAIHNYGFVFYCGPKHSSNIIDITHFSRAVEDFLKQNDRPVEIIPVFNGIIPPIQSVKQRSGGAPTKQDDGKLYVVCGNDLNDLFALMSRFENKKFHVIIDDNDSVSYPEIMKLSQMEHSGLIFFLGATMKLSLPKLQVLKLGHHSGIDQEIRTVQADCCISEVPLSMEQILSVNKHIDDARCLISDPTILSLVYDLQKLIEKLIALSSSRDILYDEVIIHIQAYLILLRKNKVVSVNLTKIDDSVEKFKESFKYFIDVVFEFLKTPTIFPRKIDDLYAEIMQELESSKLVFLKKLSVFIRIYIDKMAYFSMFLSSFNAFPTISKCIHSQLEVETLSSSFQKVIKLAVLDVGLMFSSKQIMPPRPVPADKRDFPVSNNSRVIVMGKDDDPVLAARNIANSNLYNFKSLASKKDEPVADESHRPRTKNSIGTSSNNTDADADADADASPEKNNGQANPRTEEGSEKNSNDLSTRKLPNTSSKSKVPSVKKAEDFSLTIGKNSTRNPDVTHIVMMDDVDTIQLQLSKSAPLPSRSEVHVFVSQLLKLRCPNWKEILLNFVLGVVVLKYELPNNVILLCFELFRQGRLCFIVQEGQFDLMSLNLLYKGNLEVIFLSEVSASLVRQLIGRCGRVSLQNKGGGIVMCRTPSGTIALSETYKSEILSDGSLSLSLDIGSIDDFSHRFSSIPFEIVFNFHRFLSSCRLDKNEIDFFINLMTLFQAVLYNDAFKYCCSENNIERIMTFLSCALIVMSGNHLRLYRLNVDSLLARLALNDASSRFNYEVSKFKGIQGRFVQEVKDLIKVDDLESIFGFIRIIEEWRFIGLSDADLSLMFLDFRELTKLSDLMKRFLFNLQSGKSSQDLNRSINGLLTMLTSFDGVLDQLMRMIMSSSIDSDTFQRVSNDRSYRERPDLPQQCSIEDKDTFSTLMRELQDGPKSLEFMADCLSKHSNIGCVKCTSVWNKFKPFICGQMNAILESLKKDRSACRLAITKLNSELGELDRKIQSNRVNLTGVKIGKANRPLIEEHTLKLADLNAKKSDQDHFEVHIQSLEQELAPYHGLNEEDTVCLFIQEIGQSQ